MRTFGMCSGRVAQLVERWAFKHARDRNPFVGGSIPPLAITIFCTCVTAHHDKASTLFPSSVHIDTEAGPYVYSSGAYPGLRLHSGPYK